MMLTVKSALEIANVVRPDIRCKAFPVCDKKLGYEYKNPECAIKMLNDDVAGSMPVDFIEIKTAVQPEMWSFNIYYRELTSDDDYRTASKAIGEALRVVRMLQPQVEPAGTIKDALNAICGGRPMTVFDILTLVNMTQWVKVALKTTDSEGKKKTMFMEGGVDILLKQEMLQHYLAIKISVGTDDSDSDLFIEAEDESNVRTSE